MKKIIIAMVEMLLKFISSGMHTDILKIKNELTSTTFSMNTSTTMVSGLFNATQALAMGLAIIYFCYEANSKWAFEGADISPKSLAAPFLKLIMAVILIENCQKWLDSVWTTFTGILGGKDFNLSSEQFAIGTPEVANTTVLAENMVKGMGTLELVGFLIIALIGWLIITIVSLLFKYKILLFKIELAFRIGISPLAVSDAYNGMGSNSVRWFKGMLGFILYGVAFVAVPALAATMIKDMQFNGQTIKDSTKEIFDALATKETAKAKIQEKGVLGMYSMLLPAILTPIASLGVLGAIQQVCREAAA